MSFGPRPTNPDLQDILSAWATQERLDLHTALPGRVQSYDAAHQTADVVPLLRHPVPSPDGSVVWEDLPVLPSVPVVFPRAGGWFIAHRIDAGDTVLLVALEGNADAWRAGDGGAQDATDLRRHHLGNCVAIPGLFARSRGLQHAPSGAEGLVFGDDAGTRVTMFTSGALRITQTSGTAIEITADGRVLIGGATGVMLTEGVVNGAAIDPFTGLTQGALGNASAKVMAAKV